VALALVYLFALRVCGFTSDVVKGKSRVCGSSTCGLYILRVCVFMGGVVKGKSRVCGSSTCGVCALGEYGFMGGIIKGKSRVCGSSTRVFVCPVGMWLYGQCYGKPRILVLAQVSWYFQVLCVSLGS